MTETRIDVQVDQPQPPPDAKKNGTACPGCQSEWSADELAAALYVCGKCGHHFPMPAWARIVALVDEGSFEEEAAEVRSTDPLGFYDLRPYVERLAQAELNTGLGDAIIVGQGAVEGHPLELAVMDFAFMGGSMGSAVAEKYVRACESAIERRSALLTISSSGGARMQEGILSLMTLPKTICALEELREARLPMIALLAHPTTGGVLASFASLGDVSIAEPGALIAFAGPRVVQQTTREKLPEGFGLAEHNLRFGHLDAVVPRSEQRDYLARLLRLFDR
jgi:acetyl-CoA carboxylase carboxyl transferase subunit beta